MLSFYDIKCNYGLFALLSTKAVAKPMQDGNKPKSPDLPGFLAGLEATLDDAIFYLSWSNNSPRIFFEVSDLSMPPSRVSTCTLLAILSPLT